MAYGGGDGIDITLPAAADLSVYQYRFMTVDANGRGTPCSAATTRIIGILQNKPAAADVGARIRVAGISKMLAGAALNEGDCLTSTPVNATDGTSALGFGTAAAATSIGAFVGAITLVSCGASADITDVLLTRYQI